MNLIQVYRDNAVRDLYIDIAMHKKQIRYLLSEYSFTVLLPERFRNLRFLSPSAPVDRDSPESHPAAVLFSSENA